MSAFLAARREHQVLVSAAAKDEGRAEGLWNAIVGVGSPRTPLAEAVADTAPLPHAALLGSDDVAAAYAFDLIWGLEEAGLSPFHLRCLVREVWAKFEKKARSTAEIGAGLGWDLSAAWTHACDVSLSHGNMAEVEAIARLAGRMYAALRGAKSSRVAGVPGEVYSVEQGRDVGRLLPSELVLLTEPVMETVVLERIASRRAAQYAVRGDSPQAKGPLVVALDESGSMRGQRNEWAKASAVALSRVALSEKRAVSVVHYATSTVVQPLGSPDAALRMIRHFLGGGTAIGLALGVAVDEVKRSARKGQKGADVVLITDGVDVEEVAIARAVTAARSFGIRLWTVAIECDIAPSSPLRSEATDYTRLRSLDLHESTIVRLVGAA